jgi:hypothetical protein
MSILISARHDLKQNFDWNRIKSSPFFQGAWGIYHIKSAINLATCNKTDENNIVKRINLKYRLYLHRG